MADLLRYLNTPLTQSVNQKSETGLQIRSLIWWQKLPDKWKKLLLINLDINEKFPDPDEFYHNFWGVDNTENFYLEVVKKNLPKDIPNISTNTVNKIRRIKILLAAGMKIDDASYINELKDLVFISFYVNNLTEFNYPASEKLKYLDLGRNHLAGHQDFTRFPNLYRLDVERNGGITSLDIKNLTKLTKLLCYSNQLLKIELTNLTEILRIECTNPELVTIYTHTPDKISADCKNEIIQI